MSTLDEAILRRSFGSSKVNIVVMLGENGKNLGAVAKFTALVHDNILVGDVGRIASEPAIEPFDGGLLGTTS